MKRFLILLCFGCSTEPPPVSQVIHDLPEHTECFATKIEDDVCLEVIAEHDQQPTHSYNQSGIAVTEDDPRITDPDYIWLTEQIQQCACACCHNSNLEGSGAYFWDIAFSPVWIDSANSWSLRVLAGETNEPDQTLPVEDPDRMMMVIQKEMERRR